MTRIQFATACAVCLSAVSSSETTAFAHAIAGARVFPVTLTIDDPGVADEASIPTFSFQRQPNDPDSGHGYQYNIAAEFDSGSPRTSVSASTTATPSRQRKSARLRPAFRTSISP